MDPVDVQRLLGSGRQGVDEWNSLSAGMEHDVNLVGIIDLRNADLRHADLRRLRGLNVSYLGGANLAGAKLPDSLQLSDAVKAIQKASNKARAVLLVLLTVCVYSLIAIGTTQDLALITNAPSSLKLPVVGASVSITAFYAAAPLGIIRMHAPQLRERRTIVTFFEYATSISILGLSGPIIIFLFWIRYLPRHDWLGTTWHLLLLSGALFILWRSLVSASDMLAVEKLAGADWRRLVDRHSGAVLAAMIIIVALVGAVVVSTGAIYGWRYALLGASTFANLESENVVPLPSDWRPGDCEPLSLSLGRTVITLKFANLRSVNAANAFFADADLRVVDFRGADLRWATLQGAALLDADLRGADLMDARLQCADLRRAKLDDAILSSAGLQKADLQNTDLAGAVFDSETRLDRADLRGADLRNVHGITADVLRKASLDSSTKLGAALSWDWGRYVEPDECDVWRNK